MAELGNFPEPLFQVLMGLSVGQIMDQNETLIVVVENVTRIAMSVRSANVTKLNPKSLLSWRSFAVFVKLDLDGSPNCVSNVGQRLANS